MDRSARLFRVLHLNHAYTYVALVLNVHYLVHACVCMHCHKCRMCWLQMRTLPYAHVPPESMEVTAELVSVLKDSLSTGCDEDVSKEEVLDTVAVLARRGETEAADTLQPRDRVPSSCTASSLRWLPTIGHRCRASGVCSGAPLLTRAPGAVPDSACHGQPVLWEW